MIKKVKLKFINSQLQNKKKIPNFFKKFIKFQANVVKRESEVVTPSPADALIQGLTTFFQEADVKVKEITKSFLDIVGVKNEEELKNNITQTVKTYTQTLQERFGDIQEQANKHTGSYAEILKNLANRLQTEVNQLQDKDSTLSDATKKYQVRNWLTFFFLVLIKKI